MFQRCAVLVLLMTAIAFSQDTSNAKSEPLITNLSLESAQTLLQHMGFETKMEPTYLSFRAEGYKVLLFVSQDHSNVQLTIGFTDLKPSLKVINDWNSKSRYTSAYVDEKGEPWLQSDLDLTGGISKENFEEYIKTFRTTVAGWARALLDAQAQELKSATPDK